MDVKLIFRGIADQLVKDFEISAEIKHSGSKGEYRESALKNFLKSGKLPSKYGIGSGEIVSSIGEVSKQSDLIIYDTDKCPAWIFSEETQVFPIEGICGVIEVKSHLTKKELIKGLDNIKQLKEINPKDPVMRTLPGQYISYERPIPFGIIFGYKFGDNSLTSLEDNLKEYIKGIPRGLWPNLIVVLGEGIIYHCDEKSNHVLRPEFYSAPPQLIGVHFKKDTLFEFYTALFSLLTTTHLGDFEIQRYSNVPKKVGNYFVTGHDRLIRKNDEKVYALNESFIDRVFKHCIKVGMIALREAYLSILGANSITGDEKELSMKCYLYNPENLPGLQGVNDLKNRMTNNKWGDRLLFPYLIVTINGDTYVIPQVYVTEKDSTAILGKTREDLL